MTLLPQISWRVLYVIQWWKTVNDGIDDVSTTGGVNKSCANSNFRKKSSLIYKFLDNDAMNRKVVDFVRHSDNPVGCPEVDG